MRSVHKNCSKVADNGEKQLRIEIAQDMLDSANSNSDFLNTVITGNESWIYGYDPETKIEPTMTKRPRTAARPASARPGAPRVRDRGTVLLTETDPK
ncbi:hypothetical protein J6590_064628 [Homalodisca vitripennis]|nr:hypothetical protein J6590_064628 [Homalodisca vitripennis]